MKSLIVGRLAVLLAAASLSACDTTVHRVSLHEADAGAPAVSVRALHRFAGAGSGGGGLEFEAHGSQGSATRKLGDDEYAELHGQRIQGPIDVVSKVHAQHVQLAYNHRMFAGRRVELEWFAGVTASRLQWNTTSARATDPPLAYTSNWGGPVGGAVGRLNLTPGLALEGRISFATAARSYTGNWRSGIELAMAWKPMPMLQLRFGIASSDDGVEPDPSESSDLRMNLRGPFAGLQLGF